MPAETLTWWAALCMLSALNLVAWLWATRELRTPDPTEHPATRQAMKRQALLSAGYVLGCGYRCLFPVFDVQRLCLVDSWMSSVLVGRSVATVAELCFAAQWASLVQSIGRADGHRRSLWMGQAVLPAIAVAELCSWSAVLTTANIGHVLEEALWGLVAALVVMAVLRQLPTAPARAKPVWLLMAVAGLAYVAYMFEVDVPMYWARWNQDLAQGRAFLDLSEGIADTASRWTVSHRWEDWRSEVLWMSAYFSVGVWFSIGLIHTPRLLTARQQPASP